MKPNRQLRRERERRGWSQASVARQLGVDPQTVSRWERGISTPYPYLRERLCQLFALDAEALGLAEEDNSISDMFQPSRQKEPLFDPSLPLPASFDGLIGREEVFSQLKSRLLGANNPGGITLLCGLPGVGKTALATALVHDPDIQKCFSDGILWAGVGPMPDQSDYLMRWGTLLGCMPESPKNLTTREAWARCVHAQIARRRMLLVIDDAWEIETVQALKVGGYNCMHLVTTRIPQVALDFAPDDVWTIPELDVQESQHLLARYIPQLAEDKALIHRLVCAVGGLPLALSLMGRYLRSQAVTGQPRRLQSALRQVFDPARRLSLRAPSPLIEHRPYLSEDTQLSLESVIAVSEQHIDEQARHALQILSFFPPKPNSFSEELAQAVCQVSLDVLDQLCDSGLIGSLEPCRYQLHCTISDYARQRAIGTGAIQFFIEGTIAYIEKYVEDYNVLEIESRNSMAALDAAYMENDYCAYIRGVRSLTAFWELRGLYTLATQHLQQALNRARARQDFAIVLVMLAHLGQIAREQSLLEQSESYLHEGLRYARQLNDIKMVSHFLINLAELSEQRRAYSHAYEYLHEGLALSCQLDYKVRTYYHRMTTWLGEGSICAYFTEPQQMLRRGYLADVQELFQNWSYAQRLEPAWLDIVRGPEGHIYGIPVHAYALCLVYNRRLFRAAGLDPDLPPTTWSEFRTVAKLLTNPLMDVYGFAEGTIYNTGGWRFTNWLYTAGGEVMSRRDGAWHATFNDARAVELLELFQAMRFHDQSIPRQVLLSSRMLNTLFAQGRVAMIVAGSNTVNDLYRDGQMSLDDIGLAPMPQNGGNACLVGGLAHVFNRRAHPEVIASAFAQVTDNYFALDAYEAMLKSARTRNELIGVPAPSLFAPSWQQQLTAIEAPYVNVPVHNYQAYSNSQLVWKLEPPIEAQNYYALIDPIIQAILTDPQAHPEHLLDQAARHFQEWYLCPDKVDLGCLEVD